MPLKGGFEFCGTDIASLGLEYAPEIENTYVYRPAKANVHEETFDGHDGGYMYGASKEPKEFILRCIFEETVIDKGFLTRIQSFFRVGKSGRLIFKRRPWCYYYATITEYDDTEITNYLNGIIKITMKAYYPFARCDEVYNLRAEPYHENIMANTALYDMAGMAPPTTFSDLALTNPESKMIVLGNPGTDRAKVGIIAAGDSGRGVIIHNHTTNQEMKLVALSKARTTDVDKEVRVDGISGKTTLSALDGSSSQIAFLYHDYGFIELDPGYPATRNIYIEYLGGNYVNVSNIITDDFVGQYVFVKDKWYKIIDQPDKHTFTLDGYIEGTGQHKTMVMKMNEIEIKPVTEMNLSKLSFSFKPTFA